MPEGLERTRHGPIIPFDPGIGEPEDICVKAAEKTICRTRIQSRRQFHASITVNQPYRDEYSGGGLLIRKFRVEIQCTQSIHPPTNGSCSSGETKIRNGEEMPLARTSSYICFGFEPLATT